MLLIAYVLVLAIFAAVAALITGVGALLIAQLRVAASAPLLISVLTGSVVPALMLSHGLHAASPWPWGLPRRDGFGGGAVMVIASIPAWPLCIAASYFTIRHERHT